MRSASLLALVAILATPAAAHDAPHGWRLFVADHAEPVVRAVDLAHASVLAEFPLAAPAALHVGADGRLVYAAQRAGDAVAVIDTGVAFEEHGDHRHLSLTKPRLAATIAGAKPVHVVSHDGRVTIFFDDEGVARIAAERDLIDGLAAPAEVATAAPHHGVALTMGAHVVVSIPHPDDPSKLPVGVRVLDAAGAQAGEDHACPDLHGEAAAGLTVVIACATGLLRIEPGRDAPEVAFVPYAADLPQGKATTLIAGQAIRWFVGNWGRDALVAIDPWAGRFAHVRLPTRRVHFAPDLVRPRFAHVFTEDGTLHRLDALRGEIVASLPLTEPYSMDGHWSDPRPRIAVAGDAIAVTDPLMGLVRLVDAESFRETGSVTLPGRPFAIVAVGGEDEGH